MANLALTVVAFAAFFAIVTSFATSWLDGTGRVAEGFRVARVNDAAAGRASLEENSRCVNPMGASTTFRIANDGQADLRNFSQWTLSAMYLSATGTTVQALTYVSSEPLSENQWTVGDIVLPNGSSEVFQRGIIDPGEEATVSIRVNPGIWASSANSMALTTDTGRTASISLTGENQCGYYLHNNPTPPTGATNQQANLSANHTYPSQATLYNYDQDRDALAGRLIVKGASSSTESDLARYQNWRTAALSKDLALSGTVRVKLWSAVKNFDTVKAGSVTVYLRDYNPAGGTYTEIANATLTATPWDAGASGTWVEKTISITGVNYTVAAGRQLELKLIVLTGSADDMWFAYDTVSYPAFVEVPEVKTLYFHTESRYVANDKYNQLRSNAHDAGYYLQNNPSPSTSLTNGQANLPAAQVYPSAGKLYDYDRDIDPNDRAGRWIRRGGSGPAETDLEDYQNWRSAAMTVDTRLQGSIRLDFWSAVAGFSTSATGSVTVYLREHDPVSSTTTEITSKTLTVTPWDATAGGTWVRRFIDFDVIDHLIERGNQLEIKVIAGSDAGGDMDFAYDAAAYPSVLLLPGPRESDPAGNPVTETVNPAAATGRFPLPTNSGRFVFPLDGYTKIADATWTFQYRVKRDGYGFKWLTTAVDVTPGTSGSWVDIDLSASVPAGTTGAIVELVNTHPSNNQKAIVRGKEDTRDYVALYTETIGGRRHRWQVVKVDSSRRIQGYSQDVTDIKFKLVGYTFGEDPIYQAAPPEISPAAGAWTDVNVADYVSADATGVILLVDNGTNSDQAFGIREKGSSFAVTARTLASEGNTMHFVGLDAAKVFHAYIASASVHIFLVADTSQSVSYYTNDVAVADPTTGSWQGIDADTYSVPAEANGLILYAFNGHASTQDTGLRHGDSTDDWNKRLDGGGHFHGAAGLNAANVWDENIGNTSVDVFIAAYTKGVDGAGADVHADANVVVRKANGEVRSTLGTDVANTANVPAGNWTTLTATATLAEYSVVDQTDYLEIDVFAHVTRNDVPADAITYFRIDDNSVASGSRMRVTNVGLVRE